MTMIREPDATRCKARGWVALAIGAASIALAGCASGRSKPDALSAKGHHREAVRAADAAARERAESDPHAVTQVYGDPRITELNTTAHPTAMHLRTAARLDEHARQHARAAAELERFEEAECAGISPPVRAACPVLSSAALKIMPNGIRVHLADPDATASTVELMRCHLAYARTRGFERVPDCPLYVPGVEIAGSVDGLAVELTSRDPDVAIEIVRRGSQLIGR